MTSHTPKTMSSRLMTMKFMQRSASKSAPSTPNGPPTKRMRFSNGSSVPGTPGTSSEQEVLQSALAAEERKRQEALARAAEKSGETKWVLSFTDPQFGRAPAMQVRQAGFAVIDAEESSNEEEEQRPLRMQFGGGLKKKQVKSATPVKSEDAESESDPSDFDSDDPTAALIRETRREVEANERNARPGHKNVENTPKRPKLPVDDDMLLSGLQSLSGGGSHNNSNIECFNCHQKGHMRNECPKPPTPRGSASRGRGRGRGRR